MAQADSAVWLPVLPSFKDFGPALVKGAGQDADGAGKSVGKRFGTAIVAGVAAGGAGLVAAGTALYKVGEVFDDVTDTIRVGTGATGDKLDGLVDTAKRVGQTVPAEFSQVGTTVADLNTRMGLTGGTLETVASQYLEAGRILGEDVDIAKTSAAFNAFGIEGEAVVGAMDHLFQVSQATGVGMNDLATTVSTNAPVMKTLGFSFQETAVLAGELDKAGLNSNKMMAAMSKGMVTLAKDGEAPQQAFQRVVGEIQGYIASGDQAAALELASKVFGTKGAPQFIDALQSGTLNLDDLTRAAGQTSDSILGVGQDTMDFAEAWQLFKNNVLVWLEPLGATVFGALGTWMGVAVDAVGTFTDAWARADGSITQGGLLGFMETLAARARTVYDWFNTNLIPALRDFGTWVQQNSSWLGVLASTLGGAALAVGGLMGAFRTWAAVTGAVTAAKTALTGGMAALNAVMRANPVGVVITVLAALAAAAVYAYRHFESFRRVVDGAWAGIKAAASAAWNGVLQPVFRAIGGWVTGTLAPAFVHLWQDVIVPAWAGIVATVSGAWTGFILPALRGMRDWLLGTLAPAFLSFYRDTIIPVWEGVKSAVRVGGQVASAVFAGMKEGWRLLTEATAWAWRYVLRPVFDGLVVVAQATWTVLSFVFNVFKQTALLVFDVIAFAWRTVLRPAFEAIGVFFRDTVWHGVLRPAWEAVRRGWDALVRGIQWAWTNVLKPAWDAVAKAAVWLWENWLKPTFDRVLAGWKRNLDGIVWAWTNVLKPAWDAVAKAAVWLWENWLKPTFDRVLAGWKRILDGIVWAWTNVLRPAWDALGRYASALWNDRLRPTFDKVKAGWDALMRGIRSLWQDILKPTWDKVAGAATSLWNDRLKPAFDKIRGGWEGMISGISSLWTDKLRPIFTAVGDFVKKDLKGKIDDGVRLIKDSWKGLANGFRSPINWVIDKVWNGGLAKAFNSVADAVGSKARIGTIGQIPAYAKGGLAKKGWALVGEEGPELVDFDQPGRVYTADQTQRMLGAKGPTDLAPQGALPGGSAHMGLEARGALPMGSLGGWILGGLVDTARRLLDPVLSLAKNTLSGMGSMGRVAYDAAATAVGKLIDWIKPKDAAPEPPAAAQTRGSSAALIPGTPEYKTEFYRLWDLYNGDLDRVYGEFAKRRAADYSATPMSAAGARALGIPQGVRPSHGLITSWFGRRSIDPSLPSFAANHSGVDFARGPGKKTYASHAGRVVFAGQDATGSHTIKIDHGTFRTLYGHNPVGGIRVRAGQDVQAGQHIGHEGNTGYSTGDHLHYGLTKNGVTQNINALFRDQGGNLPPGLSLVLNNTGRDEYILNHSQAAALAGAAGQGLPESLVLVVEDGQAFPAYLARKTDERIAGHVAGLSQPVRQYTGG